MNLEDYSLSLDARKDFKILSKFVKLIAFCWIENKIRKFCMILQENGMDDTKRFC